MSIFRDNGLLRSLASPHTKELLVDTADTAFSALVESEALGGIPVFGAFYKAYGTIQTFQQEFFVRKLLIFLNEGSDLSEDERQTLRTELESSEDTEGLGTSLLVAIERSEDFQKPKIIARLFRAYLQGHFKIAEFKRITMMVDRAFLEDLYYLKRISRKVMRYPDSVIEPTLSSLGFLTTPTGTEDTNGFLRTGGSPGRLTRYGEWLIELGMSKGPIPAPSL